MSPRLPRPSLDGLLGVVDVNAVLDRVDIQRLLERIEANELVARVDVNELVGRVDISSIVARGDIDDLPPWASAILFANRLLVYFGGSWAASGKTPGMSLVGLRVVARDGCALSPWRSFVRAPALALRLLTLGSA